MVGRAVRLIFVATAVCCLLFAVIFDLGAGILGWIGGASAATALFIDPEGF